MAFHTHKARPFQACNGAHGVVFSHKRTAYDLEQSSVYNPKKLIVLFSQDSMFYIYCFGKWAAGSQGLK